MKSWTRRKGGGCAASLSFRTRWLFRGVAAWVPEAERGSEPGCLGCPSCMLLQDSSKTPPSPPKRGHEATAPLYLCRYHTIYDATTASGSSFPAHKPPSSNLRAGLGQHQRTQPERGSRLSSLGWHSERRAESSSAQDCHWQAKVRMLTKSLAVASLWGLSRTHYSLPERGWTVRLREPRPFCSHSTAFLSWKVTSSL